MNDAPELDRLLREYGVEIKGVEDEEAFARKIYKMPKKKVVNAVKVVKLDRVPAVVEGSGAP